MTRVKNISNNDLGKFQSHLSEMKDAYDSSRPGFSDFSARIKSKINELQILLVDAHKVSDRLNANDLELIPELEKRVAKFDEEMKSSKGNDRVQLQQRKSGAIKALNELKTLHKK